MLSSCFSFFVSEVYVYILYISTVYIYIYVYQKFMYLILYILIFYANKSNTKSQPPPTNQGDLYPSEAKLRVLQRGKVRTTGEPEGELG